MEFARLLSLFEDEWDRNKGDALTTGDRDQGDVLTEELYNGIQDLLARKAVTEEKDLNPQMPVIIDFIQNECARQKQLSDAAPDDHRHDYEELNDAFRNLLNNIENFW